MLPRLLSGQQADKARQRQYKNADPGRKLAPDHRRYRPESFWQRRMESQTAWYRQTPGVA